MSKNRMKQLGLALLLSTSSVVVAEGVDCENAASLKAILADSPLVKVAPKYPIVNTQKPIDGCAVLTFELNQNELTSTPNSIKVEYASEKRFGLSAKRALSKWLYKIENVQKSNRYYMVFRFEIENS